jgi:hypothetical protein
MIVVTNKGSGGAAMIQTKTLTLPIYNVNINNKKGRLLYLPVASVPYKFLLNLAVDS